LDVVWSFAVGIIIHIFVIIVILDLLKVVDEILEFDLDIASVDIGSPDDLGGRVLVSSSLPIQYTRGRWLIICQNVGSLWVKSGPSLQEIDSKESSLLIEV
jgi:hypothetical protein